MTVDINGRKMSNRNIDKIIEKKNTDTPEPKATINIYFDCKPGQMYLDNVRVYKVVK